jgi:hypothetical protein
LLVLQFVFPLMLLLLLLLLYSIRFRFHLVEAVPNGTTNTRTNSEGSFSC